MKTTITFIAGLIAIPVIALIVIAGLLCAVVAIPFIAINELGKEVVDAWKTARKDES